MTLTQINKAGLDELALDHVFTIGASGTDHYTFQGEGLNGTVNDPTLYLTRGKTYRFENGSGGHPIRIQSTSGASGTAYNTGVTNNAGSGTVIVEVQHDAPDVLYYQCTSHANMNGVLYITGALADGNVTTAKLANEAVTNAKIGDLSINNAKVASNAAIARTKLANVDVVDDASPQLGGDLDTNDHHILIDDNHAIKFGASNDLVIQHNTNENYIQSNSGNIYIRANVDDDEGDNIYIQPKSGENSAVFTHDGNVELYHDNTKRFETTSNGVSIPQILQMGASGSYIDLPDNASLYCGTGDDMRLFHDGTDSFIQNSTGQLILRVASTESAIVCVPNGAVNLYHNNAKKFETLSDGAQVTGKLNSIGDTGITIEATSTNTAGQLTIIGVNNSNQVSAITRIKSVSTDSSSAATATTFSNRNSSNAVNEHMRIDSIGRVSIGSTGSIGNTYTDNFTISEAAGNAGMQIEGNNSNSNYGSIYIGDAGHRQRGFLETQLGTNGNFTIGTVGSGPIRFTNSGGERVRVTTSGLTFNGDTAAANAISDYEEGTWNPVFGRDSGSGYSSLNTSIDTLRYTKVGEIVTITGRVCVGTSNNGANGNIQITLPFTSKSGGADQSDYSQIMINTHGVNLEDDCITVMAEIGGGSSTMNIHQIRDNANWHALNSSSLQHNNNEFFGFVGSYRAA